VFSAAEAAKNYFEFVMLIGIWINGV